VHPPPAGADLSSAEIADEAHRQELYVGGAVRLLAIALRKATCYCDRDDEYDDFIVTIIIDSCDYDHDHDQDCDHWAPISDIYISLGPKT